MLAEHYIQLIARDAVLAHGYRVNEVGVMHVYSGETGKYQFTKVMLASQFSEVWIRFGLPWEVEAEWNDDIAATVKHDIERLIDTVILKAERT